MTASHPSIEPHRLGARAALGVLLYAGLLVLPWLGGGTRVLTRHEVLYARPAQEMLAGGAWIVPDFAGEKRVSKPPTLSWFVAGSMALFGERSEWAVRLPSALSGLLLVWLVASLAARWFGARVGVLAGLLQATTYYQLMQSRLAEPEMPLTACVAAAMVCVARGVLEPVSPRTRRRLARVFFAAAAMSFLLKGVGPLFLAAALVPFALFTRNRSVLRFLADPLGLLLFLVPVVGWPLAAWLEHPDILEVWRRETIGRALGELPNSHPVYYYLYAAPLMALPWIPFAIGGVRSVRGDDDRGRARLVFLACWLLPGLVLLSLSAFRSKHYAFPLLPPLTLLAAAGFDRALRRAALRGGKLHVAVAGVAAAAGVALWLASRRVPHLFPETAAVVATAASGIAGTLFAARLGRRPQLGILFGAIAASACVFFATMLPALDDYRASTELAERTNERSAGAETVHLVALGPTQLAFYLDGPVRRWDDPAAFAGMLATAQRPILFVAPRAVGAGLSARARVEALDHSHGLGRGGDERYRLTLFRFEP
jgi:4-amino-4-deoxy-L-arabinose transferase-like glycosyltransferase